MRNEHSGTIDETVFPARAGIQARRGAQSLSLDGRGQVRVPPGVIPAPHCVIPARLEPKREEHRRRLILPISAPSCQVHLALFAGRKSDAKDQPIKGKNIFLHKREASH